MYNTGALFGKGCSQKVVGNAYCPATDLRTCDTTIETACRPSTLPMVQNQPAAVITLYTTIQIGDNQSSSHLRFNQ
ncbi:hypothetical protein CROQUDRAFT_102012 [Cronartium quercuum f. sp. fusiforme G11]|uniref:Uncharacterized protein n=1 Tax=Cronartium quercuum f. sp. fusiforme G11 TaxID=708437 RepID=A0A9P6T570_9BASI|nr:hypothetical protein CROQUDRAFT_102012 [Cronartium quercuum f. sp. fusiforme G11]